MRLLARHEVKYIVRNYTKEQLRDGPNNSEHWSPGGNGEVILELNPQSETFSSRPASSYYAICAKEDQGDVKVFVDKPLAIQMEHADHRLFPIGEQNPECILA